MTRVGSFGGPVGRERGRGERGGGGEERNEGNERVLFEGNEKITKEK